MSRLCLFLVGVEKRLDFGHPHRNMRPPIVMGFGNLPLSPRARTFALYSAKKWNTMGVFTNPADSDWDRPHLCRCRGSLFCRGFLFWGVMRPDLLTVL